MSPRVVSSVPITRTSTQPSATQQVLSSALSTGGGSSMKGGTQKDQKEVHISQEVDSPMETREPQVEPSTFPATGLSSFSAIRRPPPLPVRASLPAPSHGATPPSSLSKTRTNVPRAIITFSKAGEADETETDTLRERGRESPVASPAAAPATFPVMPPRVPLLRDRRRVSPRPAVRGGMEIPSGREISPLSLHATDPSPSLSPSSAKGLSGRERDRVEGGDREKYFGVSGEMSMSRSSLADRDRKWVATERLKGALKTRLASEVAAAFGRLQQWTSENRAHSVSHRMEVWGDGWLSEWSLRELEKERRALIASVEEASVRGVQQEQSLKELSGLVTNLRGQASHAHELFGQATLARRALACEAVVRTIRKRVQGSFTKMREQLRGGGGSRAERQRVAAGVLRRTLMAATQRHVALAWSVA
uniref:Uncharacterized protein n=1 Tax=Chromera velia CCMP2878 TaxID=1169474 RepID=A0A0G4GB68_9ALVE|eukprot:Cvel_21117.t1-p1 / transcript=Cvel_21117.t1 / gene=Cvel_21117 / organism=Chromera_velia_CCMP2878 / gene_product=hypothetical protein / transcript_product=hypothetical protein / location=Cvel_scaffold1954:12257-16130(-) / protein_length=420 / sequence_SO=supercontig / SO=protein_coding / is_pseudo=false